MLSFLNHISITNRILLCALLFLLIGGVYSVSGKHLPWKKIFYSRPVDPPSMSLQSAELDSDKDGFKDWEEMLWKTDPNDPKSLPDISSNTQAVSTIDSLSDTQNADQKIADIQLTQTEILGRKLFSETFARKKSGHLDESARTEMAKNIVSELSASSTIASKTYRLADIRVSDVEQFPIKEYAKQIVAVFAAHPQENLGKEILMFQTALEKEDAASFNKLEENELTYRNIVADLARIRVSKGLVDTHIEILNQMTQMADALSVMKRGYIDPLSSLLALKTYISAHEKLLREVYRKPS